MQGLVSLYEQIPDSTVLGSDQVAQRRLMQYFDVAARRVSDLVASEHIDMCVDVCDGNISRVRSHLR